MKICSWPFFTSLSCALLCFGPSSFAGCKPPPPPLVPYDLTVESDRQKAFSQWGVLRDMSGTRFAPNKKWLPFPQLEKCQHCRLQEVQFPSRSERLQDVDFSYAVFKGAEAPHVNFSRSLFQGADFRGAKLYGAIFRGADLRCVDFRQADLSLADLRGANIEGAIFEDAVAFGTLFSDKDEP